MATINKLKSFIKEKQLLSTADKVLLAVSGGKDSMLMACLFHDLGYQCIIAHCNFQLRGEDSDLDEALVRQYADELGYPFFVKRFDTEKYAKKHKESIQMAARTLRYAWFEELKAAEGCTVICIAQHLNDHIETALLNLTRSTGLQGLLGISPRREDIVRPLLCLTAEEVEKTVGEYNVRYRDDQSNFSIKYARNKVRLEIIPKFKEIQPEFEAIMIQNIKHFEDSYSFIKKQVETVRAQVFQEEESRTVITMESLAPYINDSYLLFELFKPYNFNKEILIDLQDCFDRGMGQLFESSSHELLLDRDKLILRSRGDVGKLEIKIEKGMKVVDLGNAKLKLKKGSIDLLHKEKHQVDVDADLLIYPLEIRNWREGDVFVPLGMKGRKKLSDFFIQQKIDRFEKGHVPILLNGNGEIIWIINHRLDNRYKVTENTKKVLTLVYK
ncbi:tRNA lysidine(34) synthetase TilS [Sphingobacterium hotanense]|uniref:tRNA(Ile)-lysidine synthase n=1 Tax=Sphingobacterium hotanense TaxID=649196 RepID=A0ABT7NLQ1_9SPHI|nr:tRNA lysidine(34) synthetase TilS [Sphingobacterium hotanense]MDM1048133.1 tRNA lysidine(34) synthetase TilS [Sphingobacterium hotanense]